jgi:hypothetical protein
MCLEWPYIYASAGTDGIAICQATLYGSLNFISSTPVEDGAIDVAVSNKIATVVTEYGGLEILDCTNLTSPVAVSDLETLSNPRALVEKDGHIIVSDDAKELVTVDVSDPSNAHVVGELGMDYIAWQMKLDGDNLLTVRNLMWGLTDASNPPALSHNITVYEVGNLDGAGITGNTAYIYVPPNLRIYNISDPSAPAIDSMFNPGMDYRNFTFYDDHMYARHYGGVDVYYIANPLNPSFVSSYSESAYDYRDVEIQGSWLYLLTTNEIETADLAAPGYPALAGSETLPAPEAGIYNSLVIQDQYGYAGGDMTTPVTCRTWPPDSPNTLGYLCDDAPYKVRDLLVVDNTLYILSVNYGLRIFELY